MSPPRKPPSLFNITQDALKTNKYKRNKVVSFGGEVLPKIDESVTKNS